jgi:hypothetical protein
VIDPSCGTRRVAAEEHFQTAYITLGQLEKASTSESTCTVAWSTISPLPKSFPCAQQEFLLQRLLMDKISSMQEIRRALSE